MRRALVLLLALVVALGLVPGGPPAGAEVGGADRVLIVSYPRLLWQDVVDHDPPTLRALLERSAVASLSVRAIGQRTDLGEGYLTIGAGNRARIPATVAGDAVGAEERLGTVTGAELYRSITGRQADGNVLHLYMDEAVADADRLLYGADPGALGEALNTAGHETAVVANGDIPPDEVPGAASSSPDEVPLATGRHREAALLVADPSGTVDLGRVDEGLTEVAPEAPGGRRLVTSQVVDAVSDAWPAAAVTVVEMSDLERVERSLQTRADLRGEARDAERRRLVGEALARSDEILREVLDVVDPDHDLVMVVAPAAPRGQGQLTVFAAAGPGLTPGLASSGTTRRAGYVTLPDIGVTVLRALDVDVPDGMNATPVRSDGSGAFDLGTARALARDDVVARYRDRAVGPVSVTYIVLQVLTYAAAVVAFLLRRRGVRRTVAVLALTVLAVPIVAFTSGALPYDRLPLGVYVGALMAAAAALGVLAHAVGNRFHPLAPVIALVGANWLLQIGDIVTGGHLQIDTPFGYSPIVAGRFQGFGNLAFALVVSAAIVFACGFPALRTQPLPDRDAAARPVRDRLLAAIVAVFVVTVVADGLPMFGSDVGGVLASVPAFAAVVLVLGRWRISALRVAAIGAGTVVLLALFAAVDLARPEDQRTHLGRFVQRLLDGDAGIIVRRKLEANWSILTSSVWTWLVPVGLAFLTFLGLRRQGFLRRLQDGVPGARAALLGVLVSGVLGFALNDSGVAVPAMMFGILLPWVTVVVLRTDPARTEAP